MTKPGRLGIVVVTHGRLAGELVEAARIILGEPDDLPMRPLSIGWNDDVDEAREKVREAIAEADEGRGVLLLTDMFGGTPTNLCLSFLARDQVEIVTGANLPMVVKTANLATEVTDGVSLRELAERVARRGSESVRVAGRMLDPEPQPEHES